MMLSIPGVALLAVLAAPPAPQASPVPATESLGYFQLPDDLAIELAAAEPEVVDPIDMRFDELGRMYVVEMRDYPSGPPEGGPPLSRIKLLEDLDGDGRFETAHVFAQNLPFATGVQPWQGGVIVTLAGRVAYLKDTDGDHQADVEETWFAGFAQENSQLRANHPRFAHDNHIYIANGLRGGKVVDKRVGRSRASSSPDEARLRPTDISGRDFRFDPRGTLAEAVTGVGQYGLCFDDFGQRFVCQNRHPVQHVVFEERDLKKSKHFTPPAVMNDVAVSAEQSKLFPLTKTWTTSNLHENTFTAACGVNIYRGNALPESYRGVAFTCDPTGNLVHAERMERWGPTFRSKPLYDEREFLASTDDWFRPVAIENGPDGALYVIDMYRAVIEHPDFVPDELKRRPDQRLGDDRGRIYRIVAKDHKHKAIDLPGKADKETLVRLLAHENAWQRESAQRLIIEAGQKDMKDELARLVEHDRPEVVFHALWTLQGLGLLGQEHLRAALQREQAQITESIAELLASFPTPGADLRAEVLRQALSTGTSQPQSYLPLAPLDDVEASLATTRLAESLDDRWSRFALLLSIDNNAMLAWRRAVESRGETEQHDALARDLARLAAMRGDDAAISQALATMHATWKAKRRRAVQFGLLGLAEGIARRGRRLADYATDAQARKFLSEVAQHVMDEAMESHNQSMRLADIELLQRLDNEACRAALVLLADDNDQTIRAAAIKAILAQADEARASELVARARAESPAIKRVILEGLLARPATLALVVAALEAEALRPADIDPTLLPRLLNAGDAAVKARAQKLLAPPPPADRQQTLQLYTAALKQPADPRAGREVFEKNCATCHRVGDVGVNVAPDISDSRTKTGAQILLDILEPNRAVDGNYVGYVVSTIDGKSLSGVISAETSQSITLKQPGGQTVVVPKADIEEMISTGKSLMPEGLERTIPVERMSELVSYIKNWRYLDGRTPGVNVK